MLKRYSIAEARDRLAALVHKVQRESAVELTRRGKTVAVLMSIQQYLLAIASIVWHELIFGAERLAQSAKRRAIEAYFDSVVGRRD